MSTARQIAANRLNAKKATGPRTAAGKAACRYNSLKHGLYATDQFIFDETAEDLAELAAEYQERHSPSTPEEHILVETLVHSEWRLRRMRRVESHLWENANFKFQVNRLMKVVAFQDPCSSGEAFLTDSIAFERLQRVVNSCEREYHQAQKDLMALAQARGTPQPEHSTNTSAKLAPLRQNPQAVASAIPEPPPTAPQPEHSSASNAKLAPLRQNPHSACNPGANCDR